MTHDIIKLMYERDYVHAKATQSNDSKLWQDYRNLRNKVTCIIKDRKNAYFNDIHTLCRNDPQKMWSVPGKNKHSHITCDISANYFNHHFANIGKKMNSKFQNFNDNFLWKGPKTIYSFRFKNMSKEDIETYLGSLPNKSNNDILGMDLVLLRKSAPYISISLANVMNKSLKPRSHLADLTADLSRPWWSGEVLWSRRKVGKERGWVLEGPGRSVNLVEVSPTVPGCFELFKTIGSGREWWAVGDRALGSRVRSLEGRWVSVSIVGKGRAWSGRNQDGHRNRPTTTE